MLPILYPTGDGQTSSEYGVGTAGHYVGLALFFVLPPLCFVAVAAALLTRCLKRWRSLGRSVSGKHTPRAPAASTSSTSSTSLASVSLSCAAWLPGVSSRSSSSSAAGQTRATNAWLRRNAV